MGVNFRSWAQTRAVLLTCTAHSVADPTVSSVVVVTSPGLVTGEPVGEVVSATVSLVGAATDGPVVAIVAWVGADVTTALFVGIEVGAAVSTGGSVIIEVGAAVAIGGSVTIAVGAAVPTTVGGEVGICEGNWLGEPVGACVGKSLGDGVTSESSVTLSPTDTWARSSRSGMPSSTPIRVA